MTNFKQILESDYFNKAMLVAMLNCGQEEHKLLIEKAQEIQLKHIGNSIYGRALIELSNICKKDCYYCGIRKSNNTVTRYNLNIKDIKESLDIAIDSNIGSLAIQSGEQSTPKFIEQISEILEYVKSNNSNIGITLSCGEQTRDVYENWFKLGAERYLLRIETSNEQLYYQNHPKNSMHDFSQRLDCLQAIKDIGYQTGTGVMIGLPKQTIDNLANDIIFMRDFDIHMCGMGPFIPSNNTPFEGFKSQFNNVFEMSLRMIAVLRIVMKDINIVASTAMETINNHGIQEAILAGANIIMPNINPAMHREKYALYNKKPSTEITTKEGVTSSCLKAIPPKYTLVLGEKGNSIH